MIDFTNYIASPSIMDCNMISLMNQPDNVEIRIQIECRKSIHKIQIADGYEEDEY